MGLFIRSLLVVLIVKAQVELQVEASRHQRTVSCNVDTNGKVDELRLIVENYLVILEDELRNTQDQVKELKVIMTDNHETVSSELEDTRRTMAAISTNQETATSEQEETRRMISELQTAVSTNQQKVTVALRNTTLQLKDTRREMGVIGRQVEELPESVSRLTNIHGARDCSDVLARVEAHSGVYAVKPDSGRPFKVYCDMETDGGGWTVFQRRQDGSVDFYLDFANYSWGFGNLEGEFWLGNDNLHRLTAQGENELRVDLTSFRDESGYAVYESFSITDVSDNYRLSLGSYSGTAGDVLSYHNNQAFTTKDRDNDDWSSVNCAQDRHGAWWYNACYQSNLNGRYFNETTTNKEGIRWWGFSGSRSLKTTEMKIRRKV
ncbi:fibrinogen-like protein A [Asterias rubens]|uniref:fibrinogen-like protein A n=1 Tax=Asterias rubens TaxID=7604 RepID=UPI0014557ADA|nr:fibrinogen-like protein A [Asterias rubens]